MLIRWMHISIYAILIENELTIAYLALGNLDPLTCPHCHRSFGEHENWYKALKITNPTIPHSETYFSLFMNTDVNCNPFATTRSLSLQFMIQAVTTSFDPILVMQIFSYNSKSVWFNCTNCVSTNWLCGCRLEGVVAGTLVCLNEWADTRVCIGECVYYNMQLSVRAVFVPKPKLPICILNVISVPHQAASAVL